MCGTAACCSAYRGSRTARRRAGAGSPTSAPRAGRAASRCGPRGCRSPRPPRGSPRRRPVSAPGRAVRLSRADDRLGRAGIGQEDRGAGDGTALAAVLALAEDAQRSSPASSSSERAIGSARHVHEHQLVDVPSVACATSSAAVGREYAGSAAATAAQSPGVRPDHRTPAPAVRQRQLERHERQHRDRPATTTPPCNCRARSSPGQRALAAEATERPAKKTPLESGRPRPRHEARSRDSRAR